MSLLDVQQQKTLNFKQWAPISLKNATSVSLLNCLAKGVCAIEIPIHQRPHSLEVLVGTRGPGIDVLSGTDENPSSLLLEEWFKCVMRFSVEFPMHLPLIIFLEARNDLLSRDEQLRVNDYRGGFPNVNRIILSVFGKRLFSSHEFSHTYDSKWPTVGELCGRIIIVLSGDQRTRKHLIQDSGFHPTIGCMRLSRSVLTIHDSKASRDGAMWFWSGRLISFPPLEDLTVQSHILEQHSLPDNLRLIQRWDRHGRVGNISGYNPSIAINDSGWVVGVFQSHSLFSVKLKYFVGFLYEDFIFGEDPKETRIGFKILGDAIEINSANGSQPSVAISNTNHVIMLCHDQNNLIYHFGRLDNCGSESPFHFYSANPQSFLSLKPSITLIETFTALRNSSGVASVTIKSLNPDVSDQSLDLEVLIHRDPPSPCVILNGKARVNGAFPAVTWEKEGKATESQPFSTALVGDQPIDVEWPKVMVRGNGPLRCALLSADNQIVEEEQVKYEQLMFIDTFASDSDEIRRDPAAQFFSSEGSVDVLASHVGDKLVRLTSAPQKRIETAVNFSMFT